MKILTKLFDICWSNWERKIIMSQKIWKKYSYFPKIIHSFHNSFKKSLISSFGSMDIWIMAWMSLLVIHKCMFFGPSLCGWGKMVGDAILNIFSNVLWSLKDGPTVRLWKEDGTRRPKLSMGVSNLVPFHWYGEMMN